MDLTVKFEGLDKWEKALDPKLFDKAVSRSLNDVAAQAATAASKEVRKDYNTKAAAIKKITTLKKATPSRHSARIIYTGKSGIPLTKFSGTRQTKAGVAYRVKKKEGRKILKGAFIATMPSGHRGVFQKRENGKRLPIIQEYRAAPITMIRKVGLKEIQTTVREKFPVIFGRNLDYYWQRARQ